MMRVDTTPESQRSRITRHPSGGYCMHCGENYATEWASPWCNECLLHYQALGDSESLDDARMALLMSTLTPMPAPKAVAIVTLLEAALEEARLLRQLRLVGQQLTEARDRGNTTDFWRAIGRIESLCAQNGVGE